MLIDSHNRKHTYLRISLTERCNLRCTYCMPEEGIQLRDRAEFMTQEETLELAKKFVALGVTKIRLTGGEPLIKKNFRELLQQLSKLPVEISITTNGILLDLYFDDLEKAGVKSLNISLDSLIEEKVNRISRRNYFERIQTNIHEALRRNFEVKLNCVLMKGENDDELIDFIELTREKKISIRFIEFMPFDGNQWNWSKTVSYKTILDRVTNNYGESFIEKAIEGANSTSRNFRIKNFTGDFGIISSVTNPFCDTCNRIRLTADGKLKNCLFSGDETDLLKALRNGDDVTSLIQKSIAGKHKERAGLKEFDDAGFTFENRSMIRIGG
ncbi:MAG: GTP 3',8-cyclase MoaA [Bacteroidetes bacterium]|nr:GTP 3',8-cyclase MoaA [Bacteroidota bacterium]